MEAIGWVSGLLLSLCGVPLAVQSMVEGNARGLSSTFLIMWLLGEIAGLAYVISIGSYPLIANYGLNTALLLIICKYKYFPVR